MSSWRKNIVCLGSDLFGIVEAPYEYERYQRLLAFADARNPYGRTRITIIPTASGNDSNEIEFIFRTLHSEVRKRNLGLVHLFGNQSQDEIADRILNSDMIYVPGGNTASMLAVWRAHGVDELLKTAYDNGTTLVGCSAGALCWFEEGVTDSFGRLSVMKNGLGLLKGSYSPHGGDLDRREFHRNSVYRSELSDGIVQHDLSTLVFSHGKLVGCENKDDTCPSFTCRKISEGVAMDPIPSMPLPF